MMEPNIFDMLDKLYDSMPGTGSTGTKCQAKGPNSGDAIDISNLRAF